MGFYPLRRSSHRNGPLGEGVELANTNLTQHGNRSRGNEKNLERLHKECLPLAPDLPIIHSGEDTVIGCVPLLNSALPCPICGSGIEDLEVCYFVSPKWTWEERCGKAGWLTICAECEMQIQFFPQYWN